MKFKLLSFALVLALQCELMNGNTETKKLQHTPNALTISNKEPKVTNRQVTKRQVTGPLTTQQYIAIGRRVRASANKTNVNQKQAADLEQAADLKIKQEQLKK